MGYWPPSEPELSLRNQEIAGCIDRVATHYAAFPAAGEIERARQEFDARRGRIYDDDELFATHMALFLEWFVLERPLPGGRRPVVHALHEGSLTPQEAQLLTALATSQHSVFELVEQTRQGLLLQDLIRKGLWHVIREEPVEGVRAGDIFECRLLPWAGTVRFGPVFFFHPREAHRSIHALIEQTELEGKLTADLLFELAEMRLRYSRFRNITVERIYTRGRLRARG